MDTIFQRIAEEISVTPPQVEAAVRLLDDGATVPFIARYRKEATQGLDDGQLRVLEERLGYLRELAERRETILRTITDQGKLTPELEAAIHAADSKSRLEDLYLPYRPKRRSKGLIAREAGLEPLALALKQDPTLDPQVEATRFVAADRGVADVKAALEGAKYILMETFAEDPDLAGRLREFLWQKGNISARVVEGKEEEGTKFRDYFQHDEPLKGIPSHRALALFRGSNEGVLDVSVTAGEAEDAPASHPCEAMVAAHWDIENRGRPADAWLAEVVRWTWRVKLRGRLQTDLFARVRERADTEAIQVFAGNLKDLLLAAPAGHKATMGLDPGLRTGVKMAVVDATGKLVDHGTIYPLPPRNQAAEAAAALVQLTRKHGVALVSIGNGTGGRETARFVGEVIRAHPDLGLTQVMVNEAGASVYSASEFAAQEFPDLDVTIRGAVSIARRLQDPLAELVKIEPKSIGVGQYQHDVSEAKLARSLDAVVEDCVNAVGVDVNTASVPLLARVSGLSRGLAHNIVEFREQHGAFRVRGELQQVPRLGKKTFEQGAGFLRIVNGDDPLDASAVHPESYRVVQRIATKNGREVRSLIGDGRFLQNLNAADYTDDRFGLPTVTDILAELEKPGRDPRPELKTARFMDGVETIEDLTPGMVLEGTVNNVTNFGAFVDIGVHQDGLVHISAMSRRFVKNPRDVVKAGDVVKVKVLTVDGKRGRIGLSLRLDDEPERGGPPRPQRAGAPAPAQKKKEAPAEGSFATLFEQARRRKKNRG